MADADGSGNLDKLDVHICDSCRSDVIDFANGKEKSAREQAIDLLRSSSRSEVYKPPPFLHRAAINVKGQAIDLLKKKHPFYGNQHKKVVRK